MLAIRFPARSCYRFPVALCLALAITLTLGGPEGIRAGAPTNNPVPYVDLISPVSIAPGSTGVTLTISGTGFVAGSIVRWNGVGLTTTFVSAKKLTAAVPDTLVAAVGLGSVTVVSPRPGGGTSNLVYVPVASLETSTVFPASPSSTVATGTQPQGLVTGDFNGDGKIDLAIANNGSNNVTILLGNGDGTFVTPGTTVAAGTGANWITVGDFNEDGKLDLAVANLGSTGTGGVTILLGNGDGTFAAGASLTTGNGPFSIVTADFNGDGHLDLAVSNSSDGSVTLLLGQGDGTFTLGSTSSVGNQPQVLVPGDFNEDGILDLAVSNETDGSVSILIGKGDGTFQAQTTVSRGGSGSPIGLIAGDYNGDGHVDLAGVNASDVAILLGDGTGAFTLAANPTTGSGDLIAGVAGDYNGDHKVDLVVSDRAAGEAFLFPGNGDGTFGAPTTYTTAAGSFGVATADFNGDGALDLAFANGAANNVAIFLQQLPVELSPTSLNFGYQLLNSTSAAQVVTLTNNTGATLNFTGIGFTGPDSAEFAQTNTCGTSIAAAATCTISVTFTPTVQGPRSATLQLTDSATTSPQTLALSGAGATAPAITSANTITFVVGAAGSFTVTTTGLPVPAVTETGALPTGVTLNDNGDGTGTLAGTPATGTEGTYALTFHAHNGFGTDATQSFTLQVVTPQTIAKSFGLSAIPLNGSTTLSFTLTNPALNTIALTGVAFTDTLPAQLVVSTPNGLTGTCGGGTITASAGSGTVSLTGATLAINGSCTFSVNVSGATAGVANNNVTSTSTTAGTGNTATASLTVIAPAALTKTFGAASIPLNGTTSLSFTVQNNNATSSLSGVGFTDTLPAGLAISTPNGLTGSCGGGTITAAGGTKTITLAGATLAASTSCTFGVTVTGTAAGQQNNTTGAISSNEGGTGGTASASLTVVAPPAIAKSFNPATTGVGATTALNFTITNPAANTVALTGVAFTDTIPTGLTVTNGTAAVCGGTLTRTAPTGITLAGATVATGTPCVFSVTVTGAAPGAYTNTTGAVASTNGGTGNTATANLLVVAAPTVTKAFGASSVALNGSTTLSFTVTNPNSSASLSGIAFSDTLPAGLAVATPNGLTGTCGGGTITATAGSGTIGLAGATLAASASCNFSANVTATAAGVLNNTTGVISASESGPGAASNTATLTVVAPPALSKSFTAASIAVGGTTALNFNVLNSNTTSSLSGIGFTDTLPAGMQIASPNGLTGSCGGGTITATAGTSSVSLTGATLAASGSCAFSIDVTASTAGALVNTTGAVSSTQGGNGATATATLTVVGPPSIAKAFNPNVIPISGTSTLSFTITNPATNSVALTGVAFTDTIPAGLTVTSGTSTVCGGTLTRTAPTGIALTGATVATGTPCMFSVTVTGAAAGAYTNTTGGVTSANGGTGNTANANLTVAAAPTVTKSFGASTAPVSGSVALSFAVTNPNTSLMLDGIAFADALPAGLLVATPNGLTGSCGGGTITATAGSGTISLASATLAAGATCNFSVNVTPQNAGVFNNTTGAISSNESGAGTPSNTATLTGVAPPSVTKTFGAASIGLGASTSLTFAITNPNASVGLTGVGLTDNLPAGLAVSTPSGASGSCGAGTITATAGSQTISLSGGAIAASGSCTFAVSVTGTSGGSLTNTTGHVTSTNGGSGNTASASIVVQVPDLTIAKTHTGNFTQSQNGATYTITASNVGTAATLGTVTVSDTLPTGLTATAMAGTGWTCLLSSLTCTRSDALASNASYPAITLTVNVAFNAAPSVVNTATVSGGGETNTSNDTAMDTTTVNQVIDLAITKSHAGSFYQGETGATYTLTVSNVAGAVPSGTVSVADTLPASLTATAISGTGWNCTLATLTCTRADALAAGASYPAIAVTVNVSATAPASVTNTATLSGGGDSNAANNTANDATVITPPPDFSISANPASDTVKAGHTGSFTLVLTPVNQPFANAITFTATGLPVKSTFAATPTSVTPGANPGMTDALVYTTAGDPFTGENLPLRHGPIAAILPTVWLLLGLGFRKKWRRKGFGARMLLIGVALASSVVGYGCAGSASNFKLLGTTPGQYTITITATSGTIQHTTTVTLTVTP